MTDVVERLRDQQSKFMTPILGEAADEIERLRWELRSYTQLGGDADRYSAIWREENPFNNKELDP
jgi:hypothetical protein